LKALNCTVVLDALTPPQWVVSTLERLEQHPYIQLQQILLQRAVDTPVAARQSAENLLHSTARTLLYGYINRPIYGFTACDAATLPEKLQALIQTNSAAFSTHPETGIDCDVLLHLGDPDNDVPGLPTPKHGMWFVKHHELIDQIEAAVISRESLLWIHLWRSDKQASNTLRRVGSHSLPMQTFSITDVLDYTFGSLPTLIESRLNWLANGHDPKTFEAEQINPDLYANAGLPDTYRAKKLSGVEFSIRVLLMLLRQTKQRIRDKLQVEQWQIGYKSGNHHASECKVRDYLELKPPENTIWADPHLLVENNQTHVFFEELDITENHGRIAWSILTPEGFEQPPQTVLAEDHHLSYPFVLKHQNEFYMLPETAAQRNISLYKATRFPDQWQRLGDVMTDINAADSSLFQHDGLWWLFTNTMTLRSVDERDQLMLYYSDDFLSGNWHPHPLNPVVTGVDRARMAGPIYEKNSELFRPNQYGAKRYGYGINISRILSLSKTDYKEVMISRLTPEKSEVWIGCHTALHTEKLTVVDRLRRVRR